MSTMIYKMMWEILKNSLKRTLEENPDISEGASYHRWRGMKNAYGMMEFIEGLLEPVNKKMEEKEP